MNRYWKATGLVALALATAGCRTHHQVEMTHDVKPIHITMDINLRVDREIDRYFSDVDRAAGSALPLTPGQETTP
jgi:hypothetical protein